ncbi:MAG: hypothetical protein WDN28_15380 [Chthoniobacter sp.]
MLNDAKRRKNNSRFTAADVRMHFVNTGTKRPGALTSMDAGTDLGLVPDARPVLNQFSVGKFEDSIERAQETWKLLRDIADSKFNRVGKRS